jgi:hypothetical protein
VPIKPNERANAKSTFFILISFKNDDNLTSS